MGGEEMMKAFQPMLAGKLDDISQVRFPALASPKLDGIRCVTFMGEVLSRKLKLIPNRFIRSELASCPPLDGELMLFNSDRTPRNFNDVQGAVMGEFGQPDFEYWVFDHLLDPDSPYEARFRELEDQVGRGYSRVKIVPHTLVNTHEGAMTLEAKFVDEGFEGIMFRSLSGPYKYGRSTVREGWLTKLKRFETSEGIVVGFVEQEENQNELGRDERGYAKRSSSAGGKVGKDTLGAFVIKLEQGEFNLGTGQGLTDEMRKEIWSNRDKFLGRTVSFKHQKSGSLDLPRFPIFLGFRHD